MYMCNPIFFSSEIHEIREFMKLLVVFNGRDPAMHVTNELRRSIRIRAPGA